MLDDHSRVVLDKIEEDVNSDYINASYVDVRFLHFNRPTQPSIPLG